MIFTSIIRLDNFKNYNRNIRLFLIGNSLFQFGFGMFMIMYNLYVRSLGYLETMNGNIISMTSLATAIFLIPAGILSDKIGRRKVILIGLAFGTITFFFRGVVSSQSLLLIFAFLSGITVAFVQVSVVPFLAENSKKENRIKVFSLNAALMMIFSMLGNLLGGLLSDILQIYANISEVNAFKITLVIGSLFLLFAIIPIYKIKEDLVIKKSIKDKSLKNFIQNNPKQIKMIAQFTIATLLIGFGSGLVIPYLNLYFRDRFLASNTTIGIIVSFGQIATAIAIILGPWVVKKVGEVRAVVFLQLSSIPFLLLTGFTNTFSLAVIGFLFRQALMNAGNPIQQSFMMGKIDDNMKGIANSLSVMSFNLGWATMGPISTSIVTHGGSYNGYATVFSITAILYILSSLYFYLIFGRENKQTERINNSLSL